MRKYAIVWISLVLTLLAFGATILDKPIRSSPGEDFYFYGVEGTNDYRVRMFTIRQAATNAASTKQHGSQVLSNLAGTGAMTNGIVAGSNVTLSTNGAGQTVVAASGSGGGSSNLTTIAVGSITAGSGNFTNEVEVGSIVLSAPATQGQVLAVQGDGVTIAPTNAASGGSSSSPASNNVSLVYVSTNAAPSLSNPTNLFFDPRSDRRFRLYNPASQLGLLSAEIMNSSAGSSLASVSAPGRVLPFLTLSNAGSDSVSYAHLNGTFRAPAIFVKAKVEWATTNSSTANSYLSIGLRDTNSGEHVWSVINFATADGQGYVGAVTNRPGGAAAVNGSPTAIPGFTRTNIWVGFMLSGQLAGLFVDVGQGWSQIGAAVDFKDVLNMQQATNLARMVPAIEWYSGQNNFITFSDFSASYAGQIGLADPTWITLDDGTPLVRNGRYYAALSSRNLTAGGYVDEYRASHQSIWSCDASLENWREESKMFLSRSNQVFNDYDSHVVFDRSSGLFNYTANTWPNWGGNGTKVDIMVGTSDRDLLDGVNVIPNSQPINLGVTNGCYDGWFFKTNGQWFVYYTRTATNVDFSTFGPALAKGTSMTGPLTNTASYMPPGGVHIEGLNGFRAGGTVYVGSATTTNTVLFFDRELNLIGNLAMTVDSAGTSAPAHASIVPISADGFTTYRMLSFDLTTPPGGNAGAYGTLLTRTATNVLSGYEWPVRIRPVD